MSVNAAPFKANKKLITLNSVFDSDSNSSEQEEQVGFIQEFIYNKIYHNPYGTAIIFQCGFIYWFIQGV
jgi:hypothetical protein